MRGRGGEFMFTASKVQELREEARAEGYRAGLEVAIGRLAVRISQQHGGPVLKALREERERIRDLLAQSPPAGHGAPSGSAVPCVACDGECEEVEPPAPDPARAERCCGNPACIDVTTGAEFCSPRCEAEAPAARAELKRLADPARAMAERIVGRLKGLEREHDRILKAAAAWADEGRVDRLRERHELVKDIADTMADEFLPAEKEPRRG